MSVSAPLVGTVILNYRSTDDTLACLRAVLDSTLLDQRVVVADNTEDPAEQQRLADALPARVGYLGLGENVGFAAGNNAAVSRLIEAGARYVWILNPDTLVEPGTLAAMLTSLREHPDTGILGPRLTDGDPVHPRISSDGGVIDLDRYGRTSHVRQGRRLGDVGAGASAPVPVDYVTGACMLIDARVFRTVGYIPEDYFLYFEETDFCRAAAEYGWSPSVDQQVVVKHFRRSAGWLPTAHYLYYMVRNRGIFASRLGLGATHDVITAAYADLHETFIDPWRGRVEARDPGWLPVFDRLVDRAKADGHAGVTGPTDLTAITTTERESA